MLACSTSANERDPFSTRETLDEPGPAVGVDAERGQRVAGLVAGRAGDGPGRQRLVAGQDLLYDGVRTVGGPPEPLEVLARIGETVDVVDTEAVDDPLREQLAYERVRLAEHFVVLDPNADELVDVEEATVAGPAVHPLDVEPSRFLCRDRGLPAAGSPPSRPDGSARCR